MERFFKYLGTKGRNEFGKRFGALVAAAANLTAVVRV